MSLETKQLMWQCCQVLTNFGIFDEHGHLSARTEPGSETVVINGHSSPRTASLQDFVTFDLADEAYPPGAPGETTIHAEVFRARDDVNAVCHNHSPFAVAVASTGVEMRPVHSNGAVQAEPIRVYDDVNEAGGLLITTDEEAAEVAELLGGDRVVMLRGHGAVVTGDSVADAVISSIKLEFNSRLLYHQALLGDPWYLPGHVVDREVERVHSESVIEKSLDYYLSESL